ncbi:MAG: Glu/Leu/Phe/Val dehydrogenase [Nanoarchaeota archaeon]|nr:Glu/Leu/Phe/Val dehydrogenase [Nanoarchaeota archaeon]
MAVFENIKKDLEKVSGFMDLSKEEIGLLLKHKSVRKAVLDVNGRKYDAWRIIHNNSLGPGKGGIRYHPNVSEDEVKSLSFWMSLKNALIGLPYGGAKGGVQINPKGIGKSELEEISREYVRAFHEHIGELKDIPAPDVYTNAEIMGWMLDEYEKIKQRHEPAMITGKPLELGGCLLRHDATSKGGLIILKQFLDKIGKDPQKVNIAIQGFGNAGMNIAHMLHEEGFNITAVSDSKGGILDNEGLDIEKVKLFKKENRTVVGFNGPKEITNRELLELDVNVLILAALENQITKENADNIKAGYILELANGPVTAEADNILYKKGALVIPDILANAGGVAASYYEWCQNRTGSILSKEVLVKKLEDRMITAFHKVYELFEEHKELNMRSAAYIIAIKRILAAEKARGNLNG